MDITGPRSAFFNCATTGGKIEIDFQGDFSDTINLDLTLPITDRFGLMARYGFLEAPAHKTRVGKGPIKRTVASAGQA